jgi:hypothetical protein
MPAGAPPASPSTHRRVRPALSGSPPPRTPRITARTASVAVTKDAPKTLFVMISGTTVSLLERVAAGRLLSGCSVD